MLGRRHISAILWAMLLCAVSQAALAQPSPPPGVRGGAGAMATRSVSSYLGLERGLQAALQGHDRPAVMSMLAADFELRSVSSADTTTAEDWLRSEFGSRHTKGIVRELSVHDVDDLAIVSFLLDRVAPGTAHGTTWFVVDVWRQSSQRLITRSMTPAAGQRPRPVRPTGRE